MALGTAAVVTNAHRDPHVLISARLGGNQKLLDLPSHRARWGWVVMLGHAKLQHPPGRFSSLVQARALAWGFRDCIPAWQDAGLLHAGPVARACPSKTCGTAAFGEIDDRELVVHDWRAHQERVSRTTEWRRSKPDGDVSTEHQRNTAETFLPRTGAPADAAVAVKVGSSVEGVQGENDGLASVLKWLAQRQVWVAEASRTHIDLSVLVDQHGAPKVIETMAGLPQPLHDGPQYVYGARKRLNRIPEPEARSTSKGHQVDEGEAERAFKSA